MEFTSSSCTILTIIFFLGMLFGRKISDIVWKEAFRKWTDSIYKQYVELLKHKDSEIERLKNKKG